MSRVAQFTSYVGLVVLIAALVLLAPRLTVTAWIGLVRSIRTSWHRALTWRPGTTAAEPSDLQVEVTVGDRRASAPDEVLEADGVPTPLHAVRELWAMAREALEAGALVLAISGLLLRVTSVLVAQLPEPVVLASDLLLVVGTFLVMQRVIRDFPPTLLAAYLRPSPERTAALPGRRIQGRARHSLEMLLLAPGFLALVAWPVEIARFVAEKQFTGPRDTVIVVWACELPWLLGLAWFLARPLLPRKAPPRHASPKAAVVALQTRVVEEARQAA